MKFIVCLTVAGVELYSSTSFPDPEGLWVFLGPIVGVVVIVDVGRPLVSLGCCFPCPGAPNSLCPFEKDLHFGLCACRSCDESWRCELPHYVVLSNANTNNNLAQAL